MNNKAYLAGPDVFLPYENMKKLVFEKKKICKEYGFEGISPIDTEITLDSQIAKYYTINYGYGLQIGLSNMKIMDECSFGFFNLTPWQPLNEEYLGLHADVGTSFELGYMVAKRAKVFGYSNSRLNYKERVISLFATRFTYCDKMTGTIRDEKGYLVEDFNMRDNLMLESGIYLTKGTFCFNDVPPEKRFTDLNAFESIVHDASKRLNNND